MLQRFLQNKHHVFRRGIMVTVVQAVGIDTMGVFRSQLCSAMIHPIHKGFQVPADIPAHGIGGITGGIQYGRTQ